MGNHSCYGALVPRLKSTHVPATGTVKVAIIGSTGSIGRSALDVIRLHPDRFEVVSLSAGRRLDLLAEQICEFAPRFSSCALEEDAEKLRDVVGSGSDTQIFSGPNAAAELAGRAEHDIVLAAIVGVDGLASVLAALQAGKRVALANKESLIAGGPLVKQALESGGGEIVPVDSEHSAIFQALQGSSDSDISSLILTASGGPFLAYSLRDLGEITPEMAVKHPRWNMGAKISVDSATLVNKALELIEAHWLFGVPETRVEVVIHPQSIVHSLVRLTDGSQLAQLSKPDMKGPIAYALNFPHQRLSGVMDQLDLVECGKLEFLRLDDDRFPAVALARQALRSGPGATAVFNIANEVAVGAFLAGKLRFDEIVPAIVKALDLFGTPAIVSMRSLLDLQANIQRSAGQFLASK